MINNYVITHLHTALGSIGDSTITNKSLIKKLKELGMNTVAMTDHGSLSNMYSFYYDCIKENPPPEFLSFAKLNLKFYPPPWRGANATEPYSPPI